MGRQKHPVGTRCSGGRGGNGAKCRLANDAIRWKLNKPQATAGCYDIKLEPNYALSDD